MKALISEIIIPMGEHKTIYSSHRVRIRIGDEGGGPYLMVEGQNDEPIPTEETGHEFFLQSEAEIDEFAAICKKMLKNAEESANDI